MNKTTQFLLLSAWLILSRGYDAYSTFLFTPDLSKEANPLVSVLGFSWFPLLSVLSVLTIYIIYAYYLYLFKDYNPLPQEKGYRFGEFCAYIYLGKKQHWTAMLYKLPTDIQRINYILGASVSKCLAAAGLISTLMWLLIKYTSFYPKIHSATLIYSLIILSCIVIGMKDYRELYQKYLEETKV